MFTPTKITPNPPYDYVRRKAMTNRNLGRWLLVALAIVGLAFAAPGVSAHGDEPTQGTETAADGMPVDGDAEAWAAWMEGHMIDHMGPDAGNQMSAHTGEAVGEMPQGMADDNHNAAGTHGQGHGC